MKIYFCLLVCLLSLNGMAQFGGGNGSGYTRGNGGGVGQCYTMATIAVHACDNYALPSGSQVVNTPGTYNDTIPNFSGCDSLLTIQLTLSHSSSGNLTLSGCDSL
ncbi:MAG TPA: hypothetical protein VHS96_04000, partial [Bacteroidia bacterium]|nr:hypothetical protein [Bacteroidia bacterium]